MNTIQHASIKMLYEIKKQSYLFYIWYLFLVIFKIFMKTILYKDKQKL